MEMKSINELVTKIRSEIQQKRNTRTDLANYSSFKNISTQEFEEMKSTTSLKTCRQKFMIPKTRRRLIEKYKSYKSPINKPQAKAKTYKLDAAEMIFVLILKVLAKDFAEIKKSVFENFEKSPQKIAKKYKIIQKSHKNSLNLTNITKYSIDSFNRSVEQFFSAPKSPTTDFFSILLKILKERFRLVMNLIFVYDFQYLNRFQIFSKSLINANTSPKYPRSYIDFEKIQNTTNYLSYSSNLSTPKPEKIGTPGKIIRTNKKKSMTQSSCEDFSLKKDLNFKYHHYTDIHNAHDSEIIWRIIEEKTKKNLENKKIAENIPKGPPKNQNLLTKSKTKSLSIINFTPSSYQDSGKSRFLKKSFDYQHKNIFNTERSYDFIQKNKRTQSDMQDVEDFEFSTQVSQFLSLKSENIIEKKIEAMRKASRFIEKIQKVVIKSNLILKKISFTCMSQLKNSKFFMNQLENFSKVLEKTLKFSFFTLKYQKLVKVLLNTIDRRKQRFFITWKYHKGLIWLTKDLAIYSSFIEIIKRKLFINMWTSWKILQTVKKPKKFQNKVLLRKYIEKWEKSARISQDKWIECFYVWRSLINMQKINKLKAYRKFFT